VATGGHGGVLGGVNHLGNAKLLYVPAYKHTYFSDVNTTRLPGAVKAVRAGRNGVEVIEITIKDANGDILPGAIPSVAITKDGSFSAEDFGHDPELEPDLAFLIDYKLGLGRLAGFVIEGQVPYGSMTAHARQKLLQRAVLRGLPVVRVGRGASEGFAEATPFFISGSNLTAIKARLLLMACLMKFGSLPPARDPDKPTASELAEIEKALADYQQVFDTH